MTYQDATKKAKSLSREISETCYVVHILGIKDIDSQGNSVNTVSAYDSLSATEVLYTLADMSEEQAQLRINCVFEFGIRV